MITPVAGATDYGGLLAASSRNVPGVNNTTSTPAVKAGPDAEGKDMFLKLLVAQLKYQNPMSPMEGNEFLAQSAQFTMIEKLEEILSQAAEQAATSSIQTAAGLLGRQVTWTDGNGDEASGTVSGSRIDAGRAVLLVGETEVPLAAVREVHLP